MKKEERPFRGKFGLPDSDKAKIIEVPTQLAVEDDREGFDLLNIQVRIFKNQRNMHPYTRRVEIQVGNEIREVHEYLFPSGGGGFVIPIAVSLRIKP